MNDRNKKFCLFMWILKNILLVTPYICKVIIVIIWYVEVKKALKMEDECGLKSHSDPIFMPLVSQNVHDSSKYIQNNSTH